MHLLSAVRDEVTELRQQIRILNDKVASVEHENAFLRQHVPGEIYAQYVSPFISLNTSNSTNESNQTTTTATTTTTTTTTSMTGATGVPNLSSSSVASSQAIPMVSQQSSIPSSLPNTIPAAPLVTSSNAQTAPPPPASVNLPPIN